jgi:hypothetical protein
VRGESRDMPSPPECFSFDFPNIYEIVISISHFSGRNSRLRVARPWPTPPRPASFSFSILFTPPPYRLRRFAAAPRKHCPFP